MTRNHFTRRRFMHGLATTGAAVFAGPYILRAAEPNKEKLRIAFVGTGGRAANHVGALDLETETCLCYADADRKAWSNVEKKLGQGKAPAEAKSYTDYRKMFDKHEKDYDAVFVAVPDNH